MICDRLTSLQLRRSSGTSGCPSRRRAALCRSTATPANRDSAPDPAASPAGARGGPRTVPWVQPSMPHPILPTDPTYRPGHRSDPRRGCSILAAPSRANPWPWLSIDAPIPLAVRLRSLSRQPSRGLHSPDAELPETRRLEPMKARKLPIPGRGLVCWRATRSLPNQRQPLGNDRFYAFSCRVVALFLFDTVKLPGARPLAFCVKQVNEFFNDLSDPLFI